MKMIGIVGGVGPYAGLNLAEKIMDQTKANCDQEHIPLTLISVPHRIEDRTKFLLGESSENPGIVIAEVIHKLIQVGAEVIGIPCNTAHATPIFEEILGRIPKEIKLIHMIDEVALYLKKQFSSICKVGVLSTTGTFQVKVYPSLFLKYDLEVIQVSEEIQKNRIHPAIYHQDYGIKSCSNPVSKKAIEDMKKGVSFLKSQGAEAVILGCTEIPLALKEKTLEGVPLLDPTKILARTLILESSPTHLLEN